KTKRYPVYDANSLWRIYKTVPFLKVMKNFIVIQIARYTPFLSMKNWLYRTFLPMKVGKQTSFALMVMPDTMVPELIQVDNNTRIGYKPAILPHVYLREEYRLSVVRIRANELLGPSTPIPRGVPIGDGAIVSAAELINKDVPAGAFVGGNPAKVIYTKEE